MHEGIPILDCLVPKAFVHDGRQADRHDASRRCARCATTRAGASWCPTGEPEQVFECDDVLVAVGQENAFPWIERDCRHRLRRVGHAGARRGDACSRACRTSSSAATPRSGRRTSSGRSRTATRRRSRSTSCCTARTSRERPAPGVTLMSQKMGIHEWSYDNDIAPRPALQGAVARRRPGAAQHQGRGRARLRRRRPR